MSAAEPSARVHGGIVPAELEALGVDPAAVVDFSANLNPYGPDATVVAAIRAAPVERYPDPSSREARRALAARASRSPDEVVVGAGAAELLWTAARALLRPGAAALVVEPTFAELRLAAARAGARVVEWRARADDGFALDLGAVAREAAASGAALIGLGLPNNPTGAAPPLDDVAALAHRCASAVVVLDEAYLSLSERHADLDRALPANVVRIRSLTKEHAIPGVRVGYALAAPALAARLEAERPSWPVGTAAQAAAVAACAHEAFVAASRERLLGDRAHLADALRRAGLDPLPSQAPFVLAACPVDAAALRERLLRDHAVLVRDASSFGLPRHLRLAARPPADVARLAGAVASCLDEMRAVGATAAVRGRRRS